MSDRKPYALVRAYTEHGYGHIDIVVHELFGYSQVVLKFTCQAGGNTGTPDRGTYAWRYGMSNDFCVIGESESVIGVKVLRKIRKGMEQFSITNGPALTYAEFAARGLAALGIPKVHVMDTVNPRSYKERDELPTFHSRKQFLDLVYSLSQLEEKIIAMC